MIRTRLVIFDRYIYDLLVDSKRVRYGGPAWMLRLLARIVPRPELVILLDAPRGSSVVAKTGSHI